MENAQNLVLNRPDLIAQEENLCKLLADFISFSGHALYFPVNNFPEQIELLANEKSLLLPLVWQDNKLGVLLLHGIKVAETKRMLSNLPAITRLCLENLARIRAAKYEPRSGLLNEEALFAHMENEVGNVRAMLEDPGQLDGQDAPLHRVCLGLVVLKLSGTHDRPYDVLEKYFQRLAQACLSGVPSDVLCARLGMYEGRYEIGLLFPATGRATGRKLAQDALDRMHTVAPENRKDAYTLILSAGHALYPQDMAGHELVLPMFEQARRLRNRARLAAMVAINARYGRVAKTNLVMPYARILLDGGIILDSLPRGRLRTSLGRESNATEGMRFQVYARGGDGQKGKLRGEIVLLEVGERQSLAEIMYLEDAASLPEPGDNLVRIGVSSSRRTDKPLEDQPATGQEKQSDSPFHGHTEFLRLYEEKRAQSTQFTLGLIRYAESGNGNDAFAELLTKLSKHLSEEQTSNILMGRYGSNSLIFFHDGNCPENCLDFYRELAAFAQDMGFSSATGLACFPYLDYDRREIEECVLKALEYGILLPDPHIGIFGSVALNISADRRYSLGDIFGAIEEYRQALLADPANAMAINSLGVCMASLKRNSEARRLFLDALKKTTENLQGAKICYNMGTLCQGLGENRKAAQYFRKCLGFSPDYGYAWIRLGQLNEQEGKKNQARKCYERVLNAPDALLSGAARRRLARLAARQHKGAAARELLHEALLENPQDASAMLMLADIYLEENEDPAMVELLARKSAILSGKPEAWRTLAEALRRLDRVEEALEADKRALGKPF